MILRRREVRTLDALEQLVQRLRFVREERKAVIAISQGWRLYGDDPVLRRPVSILGSPAPPPAVPVGIDPGTGRLGSKSELGAGADILQRCEQQRIALSMLQHEQRFLTILRQANTGNTSFYPMDPRGLVVFDENIVPVAGSWNSSVGIVEDSRRLKARNDSLRTMAEVTDGIAVVQTGNLNAGMQRIVEDLSSYYLIGYYSTTDMDGKFHRLTVRVKRPGVRVRARNGYFAATRADHAKALAAATAAGVLKPVDLQAKAVEHSLSALGIFSRERPLRVHAASGYLPTGGAAVWVVAEAAATAGRHDWTDGGQLEATLMKTTGGAALTTERIAIASGTRSLRFALGSRASLSPGDYQILVRAKGTTAPLSATESVRISVPEMPGASGPLFFRRSVTTGNQPMPTADLRFRRTERLIVEIPTTSADAGTAQLLNRLGSPLPVPVATAIREDADGSRWRTAQVSLAPLAPGDYVLEQSAGSDKTLSAFRVLP
jgi:VWFA-related protein